MITTFRTVFLILLFALTGTVLHAEGINFFEGSWQEALDLAAKENKFIMVDAYTDWCGWCKVMEKETFTDPAVGAIVNENFVPIRIDFEKGIGVNLGAKFRTASYPTILFFNPSGQLVHIQNGYMFKNEDFIAECQKALDVKEERPFAFDSRNMTVPFPEFYTKSFKSGEDKAVWPKEEEVAAYLDKQDDLFSEVNWSVMWRFGGGEKYQQYLLENLEGYKRRYFEGEITRAASNIVYGRVYAAAKENDEKALQEAIALLDQYDIDKDPVLAKAQYRQFYYQQTEDWKNYAAASKTIIESEDGSNSNNINAICWTLYENCDDQAILAEATTWMSTAVKAEPENWMYLDTYAALLYKTGDMAKAEEYARKAIKNGEDIGEDVSATKELLDKITAASTTGS